MGGDFVSALHSLSHHSPMFSMLQRLISDVRRVIRCVRDVINCIGDAIRCKLARIRSLGASIRLLGRVDQRRRRGRQRRRHDDQRDSGTDQIAGAGDPQRHRHVRRFGSREKTASGMLHESAARKLTSTLADFPTVRLKADATSCLGGLLLRRRPGRRPFSSRFSSRASAAATAGAGAGGPSRWIRCSVRRSSSPPSSAARS